ncbi:hypothetical protein SSX86_019894 [Deinandra increscens subsp. villosa]|uniref:Uncharacterized protein n=1 Tax=Deinandra increscens subsp. villosa TaxID=3103831 RepID=A0AAP0CY88_9ASTR
MESVENEMESVESEMESVNEDCKSLFEQVNAEEKEVRDKRRWLLGLPTSQDEDKDVKGSNFESKRQPIPEALLREDDLSYEIIKSLVEKGVCKSKKRYHISEDEMQLVHSPTDVRGVLRLIKDMTNQGLDRFAESLTGGSVIFEKTRWKMNQIIKGCILSASVDKRQNIKLSENQSAVLKNPHNYRWSSKSRFIPVDSDSYRAAVYKILGALEALPTPTLLAMHRKIKGIEGHMPRLKPPKKSGWGRDTLIKHLRKKSLKLLSKHKGDSLEEPLAKAMDIAGLNLKLIQGCEYVTNFVIQLSPDKNSLQNEIAKCIKILDQRVEPQVLKDIQKALNAAGGKIATKSLRASVRNLLIEYLCECSDMEIIPECLHQVLAIIRKSCKSPPYPEKMNIEEDVESILSVSAAMKQLVWDLIPTCEVEKLDQEFGDAYMEDHDDDDDDEDDDEANISSACTVNLSQRMHLMQHHLVIVKNTQQEECQNEKRVMFDDEIERSMCKNNGYLAVQAATDEASMVAYRLIDRILNNDAQIQEGSEQLNSASKKRKATRKEEKEEVEDDVSGTSVVFKAVGELLPLKCEALKKLK